MPNTRVTDALNNADPTLVAKNTLSLVDRLQLLGENETGIQIAAAACLFRLLCKRFGVDPESAHRVAGRVLEAAEYSPDAAKDFEATRMYLRGEFH